MEFCTATDSLNHGGAAVLCTVSSLAPRDYIIMTSPLSDSSTETGARSRLSLLSFTRLASLLCSCTSDNTELAAAARL